MSHSTSMSHSKDVPMSHSKNTPQMEKLIHDVVGAWGRLEGPLLRAASPRALVGLVTRSLAALADVEALSGDQATELQGRVSALEVLAVAAPVPISAGLPQPGPAPEALFDTISATLPDPSLANSWNVAVTAVVAAGAVLGEAVIPCTGGSIAATHAVSAWPGWLLPA